MTRQVAIKTTFDGAVAHEVRYWLSRTIEERISGVEAIRRASWRLYGGAPTRMARVSARVEAPWRPVSAGRRARGGGPRSTAVHAGSRHPGRSNSRKRTTRSAAIAEFGFKETARDWRWFSEPYHITMMGRVPMRIDVLT